MPDLNHLKIFGCIAFASKMHNSNKFKPKYDPCVFLGCPGTNKGYLLYNLKNRSLLVSRHVIFSEDKFPFKDHVYEPRGSKISAIRPLSI